MRVTSAVPALAALAAVLGLAPPAAADQDVPRLGALVQKAAAIVVGRVADVAYADKEAGEGPHVATIDVEQILAGKVGGRIQLAGDTADPGRPSFVTDVRMLLFLSGGQAPPTEQPRDEIPAPGRGVGLIEYMVLADDAAAAKAVDLVSRFLRGNRRPGDYKDLLQRQEGRMSRPLLGSLLEELSVHVTDDDGAALAEAACNAGGPYLPAVQGWAITLAGVRKIGAARPCLEEQALAPGPSDFAAPAVEALGDLADARSAPVLQKVIEAALMGSGEDEARVRGGMAEAAALALGKIGDDKAVPDLFRLARRTDDLAIGSAVVHALGLIATPNVHGPLTSISRTHPHPLVREQAATTLQRLERSAPRRKP